MAATPGHWLKDASSLHWLLLAISYFHLACGLLTTLWSDDSLSKSKFYYDWRSFGQSVMVSGTHLGPAAHFFLFLKSFLDSYGFVHMGLPLWQEDRSVVVAGSYQHNLSWVRVPWNSWPYFTVSVLILPQPGGPSSCIYFPQEQDSQIICPSVGFAQFIYILWHVPLNA
jgi:hypothetical protein